jgi:hypothetical protein
MLQIVASLTDDSIVVNYSTGITRDDRNMFIAQAGNTQGGSITVSFTHLTGLD